MCENYCRPYGARENFPLYPPLRLRLRGGLDYFAPPRAWCIGDSLHFCNPTQVLTQGLKPTFILSGLRPD